MFGFIMRRYGGKSTPTFWWIDPILLEGRETHAGREEDLPAGVSTLIKASFIISVPKTELMERISTGWIHECILWGSLAVG
jgi:hypothetical protein